MAWTDVFFSKLPGLQVPGPQSWSACQLVLALSRLHLQSCASTCTKSPITPLTGHWAATFARILRCQLRWCVPSALHSDIFENLWISLVEYLKAWKRISLPMLPYEMSAIYQSLEEGQNRRCLLPIHWMPLLNYLQLYNHCLTINPQFCLTCARSCHFAQSLDQ